MQTEGKLVKIIEKELVSLKFDKKPESLYKPIRYSIDAGGKRLRPLLTMMSCELFGGKVDRAIKSAIAIEIFHNFTLLHDDIMDNSDIRRGKPTVHKHWNQNIAILSGDAMLIVAYKILSESSAELLPDLFEVFNKTSLEVCEGQQYDMEFEDRDAVTIAEYIDMIRLKTSVLLAGALKMGAICADASHDDQQLIYDFGENIGIAFQLRDDMLDTYGDPAIFGKKIGGDILCNKKTFLMVTAMEKAAKGSQLVDIMNDDTIAPINKIKSVTAIYDELGVRKATEKAIEKHYRKAMKSLDEISACEMAKSVLRGYVAKLMEREK